MSRRARHRPDPDAIEVIGLVALSARKALRFGLVREGGRLLGQVEHVGLTPDGRAVPRPHGQRIVLSEEKALRIVEATARIGARLREAKP